MKLMECIIGKDATLSISPENPKEPEQTSGKSLTKRSLLIFISVVVVRSVERICGLWGLLVARHPLLAVIGSLIFVTFLGSGLVRLNLVFRPYDLWVPQRSEFAKVTSWKTKNFPQYYREQIAIWEGENVLSPSSIKEMLDFHNRVEKIEVRVGNKTIKWKDICVQIPKYDDEDSQHCYETSLLEIWGYNYKNYKNLTDLSILKNIAGTNTSKIYGNPVDFSLYLGGVSKDKEGNIIRAKTAVHSWLTMINADSIKMGDYELDIATGEKVDNAGMEWEKSLVKLASEWNEKLIINIRAGHTLGYVLHNSIASDALWVGIGWTVLLMYILFTLGKPFTYEQRIIPVCVGLLAIGMSVLSSYGACSLIGIPYGTLTNVLPVLLVALGVDDMYVIVTCWDEAEHIDSIEFRAQIAMRKAGMAITVTSLTDILAFLVGTATTLPGLRWFCIYSAVGIAMVYFLQATLFVAAMVVNEKWNTSRRKNGKPLLFKNQIQKCKINFGMQKCMNMWGVCLSFHITKIVILILTFLMFLFSIFNISHLGREFDTIWLVPESSSLYKWYNTVDKTFPQYKEKGVVLFRGVKFPEDMNELKKLSRDLNSLPEIGEVEAWFNEINLQELFEKYDWLKRISPLKQCKLLLQYINFANRRHFRVDFEKSEDYETNETMSIHPCSTFQIEFQYIPPKTFESKQASMEKIRKLVRDSYISGYKAVWAHVFGQWETDRIILDDLVKNLCIVLSAVAAITLILLASVRASFFVILCVIGTLFNVASAAHLWGLTINTVTGIALVLAIGICVDYAVHIAHDFLGATGTKIERTKAALNQMGSAVFHGGASTCLAFILLAPSDNYIYVSYFKILTSVSFFGLYHALIFLPVLLSLCGPDPHPDISESIFSSINPARMDTGSIPKPSANSTYTTINFSIPYNPPPYALTNSIVGPPLYRKSSSLPSLTLLFSDNLSSRPQQELRIKQNRRSFRHSTCCTKL